MLEQLKKVDGVGEAMANHSGSLIRITFDENADGDTVASELESILDEQKRQPRQLGKAEAIQAIAK